MRHLPLLLAALLLAGCVGFAPQQPPAPPTLENVHWEARLGGLRHKDGKPLLRMRDIDRLREVGARYGEITRYLAMRGWQGERVFDGASLAWYLALEGDESFARYFSQIRYRRFSGYHIARLWAQRPDIEWATALTGGDSVVPIFTANELCAYAEAGGTLHYALGASNAAGYLKRDISGGHIVRLFRAQSAPEDIATLVQMNLFARSDDLVRFMVAGGTPAYADSLRTWDGQSISRFRQLGLHAREVLHFVDTPRPNAIVLYPRADSNGEFESEASLRLFAAVRGKYDVYVRLVGSDDEITAALKAVPGADLLWLAGHGGSDNLRLSYPQEFTRESFTDERLYLDNSDHELAAAFASLAPHATIFLDACDAGRPRNGLPNLAQFVQSLAPGRTIVAASYPFAHQEIDIRSLVPLRLEFRRP